MEVMESSEKPAMRQQVSTSVLFFAGLHGVHPAGQKSYRICTVEQYDNLLSTTAGACYWKAAPVWDDPEGSEMISGSEHSSSSEGSERSFFDAVCKHFCGRLEENHENL